MAKVNAVSKVRFSLAKPQNVGLCKGQYLNTIVVCMEPGQQSEISSPTERLYYLLTGSLTIKQPSGETSNLATGELLLNPGGQGHTLANMTDSRLVCLMVECVC